MSTPEIWATVVFFILCFVSYLIYGNSAGDPLADTNGGEPILVEELPIKHCLSEGIYTATLIRQSGNVYRDLGIFPSADDAIRDAMSSFSRAKIREVRITYSDDRQLAVYRRMYDFTGRAEGRKLAGAIFKCIEVAPIITLGNTDEKVDMFENLDIKVSSATREAETKWNFHFFFHCKLCGGTNIEGDDPVTDEVIIYCKNCKFEFGNYGNLKQITQKIGLEYLRDNDLK